MSLEPVDAARRASCWCCAGLLPLALLGAAAGGWWLAGRALAPVDAMVDAARRIDAEDLVAPASTADAADDELGRLAAVLNDMLARLERSFTAARQFSADAAHELRTPLTILKGEIEVALRRRAGQRRRIARVLDSCLEEVDRLARWSKICCSSPAPTRGADPPPAEPVDLAAVVADAAPALEALADARRRHLEIAAASAHGARQRAAPAFASSSTWSRTPSSYTPRRRPGSRVDARGPRRRRPSRGARRRAGHSRRGAGRTSSIASTAATPPAGAAAPASGWRSRSIVALHGGAVTVVDGAHTCFRVTLPSHGP